MSKIIKGSTKKGQEFIRSCENFEGRYLYQVYTSYSQAKQQAWEYCWNKYLETPEHGGFGIHSHNTFSFSVSWCGLYEGQEALFIETSSNSYIVLLDK